MSTIITVLQELSITSSILILVVLIIRKLFRNKISAAIQYSMWLVVVLRLLLPFRIPSPVSVMNIFSFDKPQAATIQAGKAGSILNSGVNKGINEVVNNIQPDLQTGDTTMFDTTTLANLA